MAEEKTSILLSDVSVEGDLVEKDKVIIDAKVSGDIKAQDIETHSNSNIKGNIKAKVASLGGKIRGNVSSDKINIRKTGTYNRAGVTASRGNLIFASGTQDNKFSVLNTVNGNELWSYKMTHPGSAPPLIFENNVSFSILVIVLLYRPNGIFKGKVL